MKRLRGFSLVELMIVIAIIGIIIAIVLPSYREYSRRATRAAAGVVLMEIVSRQEQYAGTNRAYAADAGGVSALLALGITPPAEVAANYTFEVVGRQWGSGTATMNGFQATAIPIPGSMQDGDVELQVNQFGLKTPVGVW